jgi:hypothetical protein
MNLTKLIPGDSIASHRMQLRAQATATANPSHLKVIPIRRRDIAMERRREAKMPCSAEWLRKATETQRKDCVTRSSINQAMGALSTQPSPSKRIPNKPSEQH